MYDKDFGTKDDFIGETLIPISEITSKRNVSEWYPVKKRGKDRG